MDGSGSLFAEFVAALGCRSIVVAYPPGQPLGYEELEQHVRSRLPSEEPFVLLAESFSGPLAVSIAASPPSQLKALVLVCTFAKLPAPSFVLRLFKPVGLVPLWRAPVSLVSWLLLGRYGSDAMASALSRAIGAVTPSTWRARFAAVLSVDKIPLLCRIRVPLLYLRASEDRVVFPSASALISAHVRRSKVVAVEGPHFLLQSKPQQCAAVVRAFAREQDLAL